MERRKFHQRAPAALDFDAEYVCIVGSGQDDCEAMVDAFVNSHHCPILRKGFDSLDIFSTCGQLQNLWVAKEKPDSRTNGGSNSAHKQESECALHMHTLRSQPGFIIAIFCLKKRREKIILDAAFPIVPVALAFSPNKHFQTSRLLKPLRPKRHPSMHLGHRTSPNHSVPTSLHNTNDFPSSRRH